MDKNDIVVCKASIARKLLHLGHQIIDITPGKDRDGSVNFCKVTFIFHIDKTIESDLQKLIKNNMS